MIKEIFDSILLKKRPEKLLVTNYGRYTISPDSQEFVYSDNSKEYEKYCRCNEIKRELHSRKAFVDFINEELNRRQNTDGYKSTVQIGLKGSTFCADDDYVKGEASFNRIYSEQFKILKDYKDRDLIHTEFLAFIKAMKPSFTLPEIKFKSEEETEDITDVAFDNFYRNVSKLRLYKTAKLNSQPYFTTNGEQEAGYVCEFKLMSGANESTVEELSLPPSVYFNVPFVKAGKDKYLFEVELLYSRDDFDNIIITPIIPSFENVVEEAILDEATYIKTELEKLGKGKILVLSDI